MRPKFNVCFLNNLDEESINMDTISTNSPAGLRYPSDPRVVLVHPPAISKRYLKTKFMPYGMSVIYAFLKEHSVPVVQYDFLMEYLFGDDNGIDYHNADKTFSERDFFEVLKGNGSQNALQAFADNYARPPDS